MLTSSFIIRLNIHGLLTKCEVEMAGYRPSSFLRGPYTCQKRTRPISSHLDGARLIDNGFIIWLSGLLFLWYTTGSPEHHLARSGSQSQHRVWMILHTHRASYVIMPNLIQPCFVVALHASAQSFFDFIRSQGQTYGYVSARCARSQSATC